MTEDGALSYPYDALARTETAWMDGDLTEAAWEINKAPARRW